MTKAHIEKVIRSNRAGVAAHQLFVEMQREMSSDKLLIALATEAWSVLNHDNDPSDSSASKWNWGQLKARFDTAIKSTLTRPDLNDV